MAEQKIDATKAALLASIAKSGSAAQPQAPAAPANPGGQLGASQNAAIAAASGRADQIQAPAGFYEKQAQQIAEPFQTSGRDAAAAQAAQSAYTGGLNSITSDYSSRVQQALPLLDSILNSQVSRKTQDDDFKKQQQQWQIEDRQYQMQQRQLEQKAQDDYNKQQQLLRDINGNTTLSQDARDTFNQIIANAGDDYATAMQTYSATIAAQKDKKKQAELQAIQPYISQFFYPEGNAIAAAQEQAAQAQAAAQQQAQQQAAQPQNNDPGFLENLNSTINPFSGGFRNRLSKSLRIGF